MLGKMSEAKRLHAMGFGIHWLRPRSKVPVQAGWTEGERDTISTLSKTYQTGYNIGTKLGAPSRIGKYYLAVLDMDVKGLKKKHRKQAEEWLEENFPGLLKKSPITHSGRGNGSRHIWILVNKAFDSKKITSSSEIVKVLMPSHTPSKNDKAKLSDKEIKAGYRMRPAWEIDFMCAGKQVVLPPSIHPDTGKEYRWGRPVESAKNIPLIDIKDFLDTNSKNNVGRPKGHSQRLNAKYDIEDPKEIDLELKLPPKIVDGIYEGDEVEDRSAFCLTVAIAMVRARFEDKHILGVLTNKDYFIGAVSFDHSKSSHRQRAARWVQDYCIRKARQEADARFEFDCAVEIAPNLNNEQKKKQLKSAVSDLGQVNWKSKMDRTDKDHPKPTLKNCILIAENAVAPNVFIRDSFANRDFYGCDTPWGGKKGDLLTDDDAVSIKVWLANNWKIEPSTNIIFESMVSIANKNRFHPVREYLTNLQWDGVSRIDTWLKSYLGARGPETYLRAVSRKFLVAAVARIFNPGVKFDYMLILEGLQGMGKSTVGNILAGDAWFLDGLPDLTDKDAALNLQGTWICEMGELTNLRRNEVEVAKAFISRRIDKVRPPYGKRMVELKRQSVFFGTTNVYEYLKDKTGNRRFWPVELVMTEVDFEGLKADRDQLWAEALLAFDLGEELYLTGEAKEQAVAVQSSRMVEDDGDVIFSKLSVWLKQFMRARRTQKENGEELKPFKFQTIELFSDFSYEGVNFSPLAEMKADNYKLQLASLALRKLGLEKVTINGRKFWKMSKNLKGDRGEG